MNVSSNMYDMHHIHELFLTLITLWFEHTDCFQNEVMPLFHGTLQLKAQIPPLEDVKNSTSPSLSSYFIYIYTYSIVFFSF